MAEVTMCQSCGLPFNEEHVHFISMEKDGSRSTYCTNCYKDEKFIYPNITMNEMIELIIPILGRSIGEEEARKEMTALLPTLKRWKKA